MKKIIISLLILSIFGCKKDGVNGLLEDNTTPPGPVSNVNVANHNGAAIITYTPPSNRDLLYIKAVYSLKSGEVQTVKSSYYSNQVIVNGFDDTLQHEVQLYAVNRSEVASSPVKVFVKPLISPIQIAFKNLSVQAEAGGVHIKTLNPLRSDLVIIPLIDSLGNGKWAELRNVYASDSAISADVRGLPPVERKFGFYIRDKWLNHTDTLFTKLTPKIENYLDKTRFSEFRCDNDAQYGYSTNISMMWNNGDHNQWPCTTTAINADAPVSLTWSIGDQPVKLTRFTLYTRSNTNSQGQQDYYVQGSPKLFEIYGSNNPSHSGDWSEWTKILTCEVRKPSGLPYGYDTNADIIAGQQGFSFSFDVDTPPFKYLRLKLLQNWANAYYVSIEQIDIWGTN